MLTSLSARRGRAGTLWAPRLLLAGYVVVLILVVGTVLPSLISTTRTLDHLQQRYDPAAAATSDVLTGALNQETALRGYALTEQRKFLQPFAAGTNQFDRARRRLENPALGGTIHRDLGATVTAYERWREYADEVVTDVDNGDVDAARNLIASGEGKRRFDDFRAVQNQLHGAVNNRVEGSRRQLRDSVNRSIITLLIAVAFGALLVALLWAWWRVAGRQQAEAERALADTGVLMQSVIDATSDSIFAKDTEGRHILANRARSAALNNGDPDVQVVGRTVDEFVDAELAAHIRADERIVIADGVERRVDEVLQQPDGPHVFVTTKNPLHDATGAVVGVVGVARDVTEERALRADRERLYRVEHELATTLQQAMLGRNALEDDDRLEICAKYQPAVTQMSVGGDWYDVVGRPDGSVGLIVGDVVGHGVDSATVMGQLRSALAALAVTGRDPASTLEALDEFAFTIPDARSTTCAFAIVDPERELLTYSSAGHMPPLVLVPDGVPEHLDQRQDLPLAADPGSRPRRNATVAFPVGSTLLLYSDGLIERRTESIDAGFERLASALGEHRHLSMDALCDRLIDELLTGQEQRDDVAIVAARLIRAATNAASEPGAAERFLSRSS